MAGVGSDIAEYLRDNHNTEENAIKGRDLCVLFNLRDKQIRNVVSVLRQGGEPICSSSSGYWYSNDPEDLEKTIYRMESQVANMNYSIEGLYRILKDIEQENKGYTGE